MLRETETDPVKCSKDAKRCGFLYLTSNKTAKLKENNPAASSPFDSHFVLTSDLSHHSHVTFSKQWILSSSSPYGLICSGRDVLVLAMQPPLPLMSPHSVPPVLIFIHNDLHGRHWRMKVWVAFSLALSQHFQPWCAVIIMPSVLNAYCVNVQQLPTKSRKWRDFSIARQSIIAYNVG